MRNCRQHRYSNFLFCRLAGSAALGAILLACSGCCTHMMEPFRCETCGPMYNSPMGMGPSLHPSYEGQEHPAEPHDDGLEEAPIPRFHPVPTRNVFLPIYPLAPLPTPPAAGETPTPPQPAPIQATPPSPPEANLTLRAATG